MPNFYFSFVELLGTLGRGTPESPGSDYGLFCVIDAESLEEALGWGYEVHGDFARARTEFTDWQHDGTPIRDGEIEQDADIPEQLKANPHLARCSVGEFPNWLHPWKNCDADGVRRQ